MRWDFYKAIVSVSWIIRQFCLPNPFESLGDGLIVTLGKSQLLMTPTILNLIASFVLPLLSYLIVGMVYESGSEPALGSILYLSVYCVLVFILWIVSVYSFSILAVVSGCILIIGLCALCGLVKRKILVK